MRKKINLTIIALMFIISIQAQEKGLYITGSGHIGGTNLGYKINDNWSKFGLGYGGTIGVQYFFNHNWGISGGVGLSYYQSHAKHNGDYTYEGISDMDLFHNDLYNLQIGLSNWKENQKAYFLEIPIMGMYQTKWGRKEIFGMYFGLGVKLQIPIISQEYEVKDGSELSVHGYYPQSDMLINDLPSYGFGTNSRTNYSGDIDLKLGLAGTAELGLLIRMTQRMDMTLAAYVDYSFLDMKDGNKNSNEALISPEEGSNTIHPSSYIGDKLQYNGYINSSETDKVNPLSIGGKIGVRIKLGKLEGRRGMVSEEENRAEERAQIVLEKQDTMANSLRRIESLLEKLAENKDMDRLITLIESNIQKEPEGMTADEMGSLKERVFFDLNSSQISPASKIVLNRKVNLMNRYPEMKVRVLGNTCDIGSERINIPLGLKRAEEVKRYMVEKGVDPSRIVTVSQSDYDPMLPNTSEENRALNRRVDFELIIE